MFRICLSLLLALVLNSPALSAAQAINGTIEGTVIDDQGGVLPGVAVTVTNLDTGDTRTVVSNESGLYRLPLLPLGTYRISVELAGFKKFEQTGIVLRAGQTAVINVKLTLGAVAETVTVTGDTPIVDLGKIEQGRTLTEAEIKTLPLTSRNPYNFALLQPGVVGFETNEFGVPRLTANGALLRVHYQVDGSNNTQKDRAGLRQMPMSEVMIREVKVVTSGYAPEFGQTMGLVYNAITPSGTNVFKGQGSYRFQRQPMVAFPFFTLGPHTDDRKPPTDVNVYTFDLGGPIVRNRTHFFGGYEHTERDLSGLSVITISPSNQAALGLSEPPYMPRGLNTEFAIGKVDHQISLNHRLSFRYMLFDNFITANVAGTTSGVANSVEQATDFSDRQHSTGGQLVSVIGTNMINELRVQYATRAQGRVPSPLAGTGPAVRISGVANIGGPIATTTDAGFGFTQNVLQMNDSVTLLRGNHAFKGGVDLQFVDDTRTAAPAALYTFPSVAAYLDARNGINRLGYTSFTQYFGLPDLEYDTSQYGFFVQDDWRLSADLKVLYGVRYDLYGVPDGDPDAPIASSREFPVSKSNFGPRLGAVWTLGAAHSVLRANTGLMYDQTLNAIYEQALQQDGTTARASATFTPTQVGAPAFPATLSAGTGVASNTAWTVDPDFKVGRSWQNNVQYEYAINDSYAVSIGASYVKGYNLPVVTNVNVINPIGTLADGIPIFSPTVSAATRVDPRYSVINSTQSIGESTYKNMTLQFTRRHRNGIGFDLAYTLGKSEDNAPITNILSVQGDVGGRIDPTNLDRDLGPNILDQRHTFAGSIVAAPRFSREGAMGAILNDNVFGLALQFASGIPVNLRSNLELNNDGTGSDRPSGVARNSLNLPARYNVDARYSRRFVLHGAMAAEVIAELKNVFNTVQVSGVNSTLNTNNQGVPLAPLPTSGDDLTPNGGYEQRQFQLGFRFIF